MARKAPEVGGAAAEAEARVPPKEAKALLQREAETSLVRENPNQRREERRAGRKRRKRSEPSTLN